MILTNIYNLSIMCAYVLLFCLIKVASSISAYDFLAKFEKRGCVEGTILDVPGSGQIRTELVGDGALKESDTQEDSEKTHDNPLSAIHTLAAYHKLSYDYYLESEEGPSHDPKFAITLTLGDEKYAGNGPSIRDAKRAAAALALSTTEYPAPPPKAKENSSASTPTVELNSLAYKLGLKVTYLSEEELLNEDFDVLRERSSVPDTSSYHERLNASTRSVSVNGDGPTRLPFVVVVVVGETRFSGTGFTKQAARHDAASKALEALTKMSSDEKEYCLAYGTCDKEAIKSPISSVYEFAQLKQLNLEYKIIREEGPAHDRDYVTQCTLGDLVSEGIGRSKKKSKLIASEKMLEQLRASYPDLSLSRKPSSVGSDTSLMRKKRKKKQAKVTRGFVGKFAQDAKDLLAATWGYLTPGDTSGGAKEVPSDGLSLKNREQGDSGESKDFKGMLLGIARERGIVVHFSDLFKEDSKYFSLLQIGLQPNYVCLGDGHSFEEARTKASMEAMHFLHKIGLDNISIGEFTKPSESLWTKTHEEVCLLDAEPGGNEERKS